MTEFIHEPVLLKEALSALQPAAGLLFVDGTVGGGGHAEAILSASGPDGRLVDEVAMTDPFTTNIAFGGPDMRTAYVTLSATGQLVRLSWPRPGLRLAFNG